MSKQGKKQSFLSGAAILAAAVVMVKLIGAVFKIPLGNIIGDEGKTYFDGAYKIYDVLLAISTNGLPLAISKLTSESHALGRENEKRKLFRVSVWLFLFLGTLCGLFMFTQADWLSEFIGVPLAWRHIRVLSPAVFCVCLIACIRGYTQGQGNMQPTAISQVLEAICKLGIGLTLAWYCVRIGLGVDIAAAGAILGVTVGTVVSLLFLTIYLLRHWNRQKSSEVPPSSTTLMQRVLSIGIPITLSNSAMSIITLIDMKIIMDRLNYIAAALSDTPTALYGQYSFGMDLTNLPPSFVAPVTMSLIPFAAAALTRHDNKEAGRIVTSAFRLVSLLAIPAAVGLCVLGGPILLMLYPAQQEAALAAAPHMSWLGLSCIFTCMMALTNAILQTYGKVHIPIVTVILGGLLKITLNYILVGQPELNIHGAAISTFCCYLLISILNLYFVWKYSPEKPRYLQIFVKPSIASALMGGMAWGVYGLAYRALTGGTYSYRGNALATLIGILSGVAVYFILVIAMGILRAEDVQNMKWGPKLIRILHLR